MALTAGQTGHFNDTEESVLFKNHGATASTARPTIGSSATAAASVVWQGTVAPDNGTTADRWWDETNEVWKRFDGTSWVVSGVVAQWMPRTIDPVLADQNVGTPLANRGYWKRVVGPTRTITSLRILVSTQSGNIALGVWRATGEGDSATPGTKVVYTGSIACPAAGQADVSLGGSFEVRTGDFILFNADNTTAKIRGHDNGLNTLEMSGWSGFSGFADLGDPGDSPTISSWIGRYHFYIAGVT